MGIWHGVGWEQDGMGTGWDAILFYSAQSSPVSGENFPQLAQASSLPLGRDSSGPSAPSPFFLCMFLVHFEKFNRELKMYIYAILMTSEECNPLYQLSNSLVSFLGMPRVFYHQPSHGLHTWYECLPLPHVSLDSPVPIAGRYDQQRAGREGHWVARDPQLYTNAAQQKHLFWQAKSGADRMLRPEKTH